MEKQSLERLLAQGESVERIAKRFDKDPSTVSHWIKKYGLSSLHAEKHAAKGAIERSALDEMVASGASITHIAETLQRSQATVRHWLKKYGLDTQSTVQRRVADTTATSARSSFITWTALTRGSR